MFAKLDALKDQFLMELSLCIMSSLDNFLLLHFYIYAEIACKHWNIWSKLILVRNSYKYNIKSFLCLHLIV